MEQVASLSANGVRIYLLGKSDQYCDIECMLLIIQRLKLYHTNSLEIEDLTFEMFYNVRDINYTEIYTTWDRT